MLVFSFLYFLHFQSGYSGVWKSRIRRSAGCLIFHFCTSSFLYFFAFSIKMSECLEEQNQEVRRVLDFFISVFFLHFQSGCLEDQN